MKTVLCRLLIKDRHYPCSLPIPTFSVVHNHRELDLAVAVRNLHVLRIDTSELRSLVVRQSIHGALSKIEAGGSVVDGEDINRLPIVGDAVARAALQGSLAAYNEETRRALT